MPTGSLPRAVTSAFQVPYVLRVPFLENPWLTTLGANLVNLLLGVLTGAMAARLLQSSGRGEFAAIVYWPTVIGVVGVLSVPDAIAWRSAERQCAPGVTASGLLVVACLAVVVVIAGNIILPSLIGFQNEHLLSLTKWFLAFYVPCTFVTYALQSVDIGRLRLRRYNFVRIMTAAMVLAGYMYLYFHHTFEVKTATIVNIVGVLCPAAYWVWVSIPELARAPQLTEALVLLRQGCIFHPSAVLLLIALQMDKAVILWRCTPDRVGLYAVAFTFAGSGLNLVTNAFQVVGFGEMANLADPTQQTAYLLRRLSLVTTVLCLGTGLFLAFGSLLMAALFGTAYRPAFIPAAILLVGYVPLALRQVIVKILKGAGEAKAGIVAESIAVITFVLAAAVLRRSDPLVTVPASLAIANSLALVFLAWQLARRWALKPSQWMLLNFDILRRCAATACSMASHNND